MRILLVLATSLLAACGANREPQPDHSAATSIDTSQSASDVDYNVVFDSNVVVINAGREEAIASLPDLCSTFKHEYVGLYPIIDTLPTITEDSIILTAELRQRGFHNIHTGHGNWQHGPRLRLVVLANEACTCAVTKLYYIHGQQRADSTYGMRVTERLFCNTDQ